MYAAYIQRDLHGISVHFIHRGKKIHVSQELTQQIDRSLGWGGGGGGRGGGEDARNRNFY